MHLALPAEEVAGALELDPRRGVEQGGEARRVTRVPPVELPPRRSAAAPGPVGSGVNFAAAIVALFGVLALLAVFVFWSAPNTSDAFPYFAVPGVLFAVAGFLGYRWSGPWSHRR